MADITPKPYQDTAVFQPGTGGVFYAEPGTEPPTLAELKEWVDGDRTQGIGSDWTPLGYTSLDELPGLGSETEGGEKIGVWENADFKITPITSTDTVMVKPVQWSEVPISHRFGKGVKWDKQAGKISVPKVYTSVEVAIMVVILDGDRPLVLHYYRAASAPDGDLELDPEKFATLPIKYTVLGYEGKAEKMNILAYHLQTTDSDSDGIQDILDDTPEEATP